MMTSTPQAMNMATLRQMSSAAAAWGRSCSVMFSIMYPSMAISWVVMIVLVTVSAAMMIARLSGTGSSCASSR